MPWIRTRRRASEISARSKHVVDNAVAASGSRYGASSEPRSRCYRGRPPGLPFSLRFQTTALGGPQSTGSGTQVPDVVQHEPGWQAQRGLWSGTSQAGKLSVDHSGPRRSHAEGAQVLDCGPARARLASSAWAVVRHEPRLASSAWAVAQHEPGWQAQRGPQSTRSHAEGAQVPDCGPARARLASSAWTTVHAIPRRRRAGAGLWSSTSQAGKLSVDCGPARARLASSGTQSTRSHAGGIQWRTKLSSYQK